MSELTRIIKTCGLGFTGNFVLYMLCKIAHEPFDWFFWIALIGYNIYISLPINEQRERDLKP